MEHYQHAVRREPARPVAQHHTKAVQTALVHPHTPAAQMAQVDELHTLAANRDVSPGMMALVVAPSDLLDQIANQCPCPYLFHHQLAVDLVVLVDPQVWLLVVDLVVPVVTLVAVV